MLQDPGIILCSFDGKTQAGSKRNYTVSQFLFQPFHGNCAGTVSGIDALQSAGPDAVGQIADFFPAIEAGFRAVLFCAHMQAAAEGQKRLLRKLLTDFPQDHFQSAVGTAVADYQSLIQAENKAEFMGKIIRNQAAV